MGIRHEIRWREAASVNSLVEFHFEGLALERWCARRVPPELVRFGPLHKIPLERGALGDLLDHRIGRRRQVEKSSFFEARNRYGDRLETETAILGVRIEEGDRGIVGEMGPASHAGSDNPIKIG